MQVPLDLDFTLLKIIIWYRPISSESAYFPGRVNLYRYFLVLKCFASYLFCVCECTDVEVDVDELNKEQVLDLNKMATPYGMAEGDFVR